MKTLPRLLCILMMLCVSVPALWADKDSDAEGMDKVYKNATIKGGLSEVLPKIAQMGGRELVVDWAALKRLGVKKDTRVSLSPSGAKVSQILDLVLAQVARRNKPLGWFEISKTVYVTSQLRAMRKDTTVIRVANRSRKKGKTSGSSLPLRPRNRGGEGVSWDKAELHKVLNYVRKAGKVNMVVNWKALEQSGIEKTSGVSLKLRRATLATVLDLVMEQVNGNRDKYSRAYWIIEKGIVKITTGNMLNRKTVTKSWDISDLTHPVEDHSAPKMSFDSVKEKDDADDDTDDGGLFEDLDEDDDDGEDGKVTRKQMEEKIVEMVKESIDRDMWKDAGGKGSIAVYQGKLIITQTQLGWKLLEGR
jgi:hypothetical protein